MQKISFLCIKAILSLQQRNFEESVFFQQRRTIFGKVFVSRAKSIGTRRIHSAWEHFRVPFTRVEPFWVFPQIYWQFPGIFFSWAICLPSLTRLASLTHFLSPLSLWNILGDRWRGKAKVWLWSTQDSGCGKNNFVVTLPILFTFNGEILTKPFSIVVEKRQLMKDSVQMSVVSL